MKLATHSALHLGHQFPPLGFNGVRKQIEIPAELRSFGLGQEGCFLGNGHCQGLYCTQVRLGRQHPCENVGRLPADLT